MAADLRAAGDAAWHDFDVVAWNRAIEGSVVVPIAEDAAYVATRGVVGNVTLVRTLEGLVVIDSGSRAVAAQILDAIRRWDKAPIHTIIYTHGHIDHAAGAHVFDTEAQLNGAPRPRVVAQANLPARFARYRASAGWNTEINGRQFANLNFQWPTDFREPDLVYDDRLTLEIGGVRFELHHGMGETDDHTWTWIPHRRLIASGDFVIWAAPNAGNPQKVQRYAKPWAEALKAMAALGAETLVPGHGPGLFGADRVAMLLTDTAQFLDTIHDQTLDLMNEGRTLDEVLRLVRLPTELMTRPFLKPTYDDPEFLIRNIWRFYGGWWDGDPAHLKPAPAADLAARAQELMAAGSLRLAGHLAELAVQAAPDDAGAHAIRAAVNQARMGVETSLMAKGIFGAAMRASSALAKP